MKRSAAIHIALASTLIALAAPAKACDDRAVWSCDTSHPNSSGPATPKAVEPERPAESNLRAAPSALAQPTTSPSGALRRNNPLSSLTSPRAPAAVQEEIEQPVKERRAKSARSPQRIKTSRTRTVDIDAEKPKKAPDAPVRETFVDPPKRESLDRSRREAMPANSPAAQRFRSFIVPDSMISRPPEDFRSPRFEAGHLAHSAAMPQLPALAVSQSITERQSTPEPDDTSSAVYTTAAAESQPVAAAARIVPDKPDDMAWLRNLFIVIGASFAAATAFRLIVA